MRRIFLFSIHYSLLNVQFLNSTFCIKFHLIYSIGVRLGEFNLATQEDCDERGYCASPTQDFLKEKFIVHPDYNPKTLENDIALIRLATSANFSCGKLHSANLSDMKLTMFLFSDNVQPICLPINDADLSGKFVTVSGWGVTEEGKTIA